MSDKNPRGKHVLIVDDTEEIIDLFRDIVVGMGHEATGMMFAPDDLTEVQEIGPDLVILDLMIGAESRGWQLAQEMRMSPATAPIPLIVCTAALDDVREQEGWLAAQGITVVPKPVPVHELELAISKAVAVPELLAR